MAVVKTKTTRIPKLRVKESVKRANDFEHTKRVMDHYIAATSFIDEVINPTVRDLRLLYVAYNNELPDSYFRYVTNPLNSANQDYTNWPARIRAYSIIRPNIDLIQGEYERRPFSYTVKVNNDDAVNAYQDQQYQEILASLQQQFVNSLNNKGMDTGQESQEPELPEGIKKKFTSNYRDQRAIMGEDALSIIFDQFQLIEFFKNMFFDWTVAGECHTYKGIRGGRMVYERISPLDVDYDKSPDTDYIEDGSWAVRRMYLTPAQINDMFYDELKIDDIDLIEDENGHLAFRGIGTGVPGILRDDQDLRRSKVPVYHATWKYYTNIGLLTYTDEMGEEQQMEVPETYKAGEGESVDWYWVNEVWEGYRISDSIYLGIKPVPAQRNTINNMSMCKLPYNGRRFSDRHASNISLVEMGLPYETLHRILHFHLEKTIAKSKGKILMMDYNAIPKKDGWDEEKFFYWSEANGWALIDRNQPGVDKQFNQYQAVDMGLYQHISSIIEIMEYIKQEWDDLLGITRQRKGDVKSSDTVRGTQAAIIQSAVISEKIFSKFEDFVRCEMQGLLDVSKLAWVDGFQRLYQGDDMRTAILSIDPAQYLESDMNVTVSRSARDLQNLEMVRQQVQAFAQNGVSPSTIVDVVQAQSLSKLRGILQDYEAKAMQAQQQQGVAEQEGMERLEGIKAAQIQLESIEKQKQINLQYDREEDLELLKQSGEDQNTDTPGADPSAATKVMLDDQNTKRDLGRKEKELNLKERVESTKARQKDREIDLKEKQITVQKQIAKEGNATTLKAKKMGNNKPKPSK